jgi:hypothetical protein
VYSHIHAVKTQQISQIVSLYNKQHYVITTCFGPASGPSSGCSQTIKQTT